MPIYAFSSQSDLDRIAESVKKTESRESLNPDFLRISQGPFFARVTSIVSDTDSKRAKAVSLVYDIDSHGLIVPSNSFVYDSESTLTTAQRDIFSDTALSVDQDVELMPYADSTGEVEWLVRKSGGAQRPVIKTAGDLAFGAELEGINGVIKSEFTSTQFFRALLPWGDTVDLPDDFIFTADIDTVSSSGTTYYTEAWPTSMYAFPEGSYPAVEGYTTFKIRSSNVETSTLLYDSSAANQAFNLILDNFDFANASTAAKNYYLNFGFPVSFSVVDQAFYFTSPLIG